MSSSSTSSTTGQPGSRRSSTGGSPRPPVEAAAVVTHGKPGTIGPAVDRLQAVAREAGVELLFDADEAAKHGIEPNAGRQPDLVVVLGGDGTMLRALARFLGSGVPVLGVNFGRVGFLTSIGRDDLESGMMRVFAGDYDVVELPTLELELDGERRVAVNDVGVTSATLGRMIQLSSAIGGEDLGVQPCDGLIVSTPSGSTAYNLSNGGPVLVWGLDAMVLTFVAPHSLHVRPLVVGRGADLQVWNRTSDVRATILVDGHAVTEVGADGRVCVHLGPERSLLATLPEQTFFRRYGDTFGGR
jgi:NAD+ kinase